MITEQWTKSTFSGPNCDNCIFCRLNGDTVEVRKDENGPVQPWTRGEWEAFIAGAKAGQFDLPA